MPWAARKDLFVEGIIARSFINSEMSRASCPSRIVVRVSTCLSRGLVAVVFERCYHNRHADVDVRIITTRTPFTSKKI